MSNEDRIRFILSDLGKATLRGVKKCPKCGTLTGSRGLSCKNKFCDVIFKESGDRCKLSTKACKLITNSLAQIFSIRIRGKGPDYRGFVQLPVVNATVQNDMTTVITKTSSLCFVESCQKSFDTGVLQCHEEDKDADKNEATSMCQHIQAAYKCYAEAQPLPLKNSLLSTLNVSCEMKKKIWCLATESIGPLVQRISKNIMAVKCKASPKHPLGYLHIIFFTIKVKDKIEYKYTCECPDPSESKTKDKRCVHFYASSCAFKSDPKLCEEFDYYINLDENEHREQKQREQELRKQLELQKKQQLNEISLQQDADKLIEIDFGPLDDHHLLILHDAFNESQGFDEKLPDIDSIPIDPNILQSSIGEININQCVLTNSIDDVYLSNLGNQRKVIDASLGESTFADLQTINIVDQSLTNSKYIINDDEDNGYLFNTDYSVQTFIDDQNVGLENIMDGTLVDTNSPNKRKNINVVDVKTLPKGKMVSSIKRKHESMLDNKSFVDFGTISSVISDNHDEKIVQSNKASQLNGIKRARTNHLVIKRRSNNNQYKKNENYHENVNESNVNESNISFIKWLSSVTERINQTMHFQFDGKPEPLVFHVPQVFFDCLRERISCGGKKKRLPNSITAFVRTDAVPLGTFTKYTWLITNIFHVKSIFETPIIPLEITRSFIQNSDGSYELYKRQETDIDHFKKTERNALIKPLELKTFLKVGYTSPNQREPTPFVIEWIPDLLPISKIGELRIKFEFDHKKNDPTDREQKKTA